MRFVLFEKPCVTCGEPILGPREGGKARGLWLGYDECEECRKAKAKERQS